MRAPDTTRALLFALVAGLGCFAWQLTAAPWLGYGRALSAYLLGLVVLAPVSYATSARRAVQAALVSLAIVLPALLFDPSPRAAVAVGVLALGLARSGAARRLSLGRGLCLELVVGLTAVFVAALVLGGSVFADGLAVWSFWLVQAAYGLLATGPVATDRVPTDAFEQARDAADRLLRSP